MCWQWGKTLSHKNTQYNYDKKMFIRRAKPIRIIGDPDNHQTDKWSFTVLRRTSGHALGS